MSFAAQLLEAIAEDVTDAMAREIRTGLLPQHLRNWVVAENLTPARKRVLEKFDGIKLGYVSNPLIYDRAFRSTGKAEHKALIGLVLAGHMRVFRIPGKMPVSSFATPGSYIGAEEEFHYELRKKA